MPSSRRSNQFVYWFSRARLPDEWRQRVRVTVDAEGVIQSVEPDVPHGSNEQRLGTVIPGLPNTHSHAFQRAMAGLAEHRMAARDTFWSWRDSMYRIANRVTPEDLQHVAAQLYVEMLKAGFTSVAEFHYIHNTRGGRAYARPAEMSFALLRAAGKAGIGITLLPVLYQSGGFGEQPLTAEQRRFGCDVDEYLAILEQVTARCNKHAMQHSGLAIHSLRAVPPAVMNEALMAYRANLPEGPVHIHVAEQTLEVDQCKAALGARPVEWLLGSYDLDRRWCLIHATHMNARETDRLARSGAVVSICPTTEANLGDGLFPLPRYLTRGGRISIGSDSNVSVSAIEELRWLEYAQRLKTGRRNVVTTEDSAHTGDNLFNQCWDGGRRALNQTIGKIAPGYRADWLVLDDDNPIFAHVPTESLLDAVVFASQRSPFKDVMVGGQWKVRDFQHPLEAEIAGHFRATLQKLI